MSTYDDLMLEAQVVIDRAEDAYEHARYQNNGEVTPMMEEVWYEAMQKAEQIQAQAAREEQYRREYAEEITRAQEWTAQMKDERP